MRQQINLYQPELREHRRNFSARVCLLGVGAVLAGVCLIYSYGHWQVHGLAQSVEQLTLRRDIACQWF